MLYLYSIIYVFCAQTVTLCDLVKIPCMYLCIAFVPSKSEIYLLADKKYVFILIIVLSL